MKRDYNQDPTIEVAFFIGTEVEKTPAYGKKTLFVVGLQRAEEIKKIAQENNITHVYLGANMSFNGSNALTWCAVAIELLNNDFWVTLDYKLQYYETVLGYELGKYDRYIDMISIPLPFIKELNYNACIKLDDQTFRYSNPGVWVHQVHALQNREAFTDWSKYKDDTVIT